jgi:hypothetical protein
MSTQAQEDWVPDPAWPITAIPQRWVETLFGALMATYGVRFADLWRGADIAVVKRQWGIELAKLTSSQMKAGRDNLMALIKAPTCPEFIAHCKQSRMEAAAHEAPKLENLPRMTPEQAAEGLAKVHAGIRKIRRDEPGAEWAFRILLGKKPVPFEVSRHASDAVTSPAGKSVVDNCADSGLREEYRALRQRTIEDYRMRGVRLWGVL